MKELYGDAFSFFFTFYADTSQLWHTIDPFHISSSDSDEGFQQGDPASTALYCIGITGKLIIGKLSELIGVCPIKLPGSGLRSNSDKFIGIYRS